MKACGLVLVLCCLSLLSACQLAPEQQADHQRAAELYVQLGQQYWQQGNIERAGQRLQKAVELAPQWGEARLVLASWYAQHGDRRMVESQYMQALALLGDDARAYSGLGAWYCQQSQVDKAIEAFQRAAEARLNAAPAMAYTQQARCYWQWVQYGADIDWVQQALTLALAADAEYAPALWLQTELLWQQGQSQAAYAMLQRYRQQITVQQMPVDALKIAQAIVSSLNYWSEYNVYQQALQRPL